VGALFVVLLVAAALFGFTVLKDRVRVVVQSDAPATGSDPTALLRDDVQVLAGRVGELQAALSQNFEQLQAAIEERAAARHADVMALRREVGATRQLLDHLTQDVVALREQVRGLPAQAAAPQPSAPTPGPQRVEVAPEVVVPVEVKPSPPAPAEPAPAVPQAKPAPGFLSFSLPTVQFRCDELQDYALLPGLCRLRRSPRRVERRGGGRSRLARDGRRRPRHRHVGTPRGQGAPADPLHDRALQASAWRHRRREADRAW
jgi:hypothetical protein